MNEPINIATMSIDALKALAYDELVKRQNCENNLILLKEEIAKRQEVSSEPETAVDTLEE